MPDALVTFVTKPDEDSRCEQITHLGGADWTWTREQVIASIEAGTNTFHVIDAEKHRSDIGVISPGNGRARYLRTHADGYWNDNLLILPSRPQDPDSMTPQQLKMLRKR